MILEEPELLPLLGVPVDTPVEVESGGLYPSLADHVTIGTGPSRRTVIVRSNMDDELAQNHAAIVDALTAGRYGPVPRVYAIARNASIEEEVQAVSGLALQMEPVVLEATIDALAALHHLPLREGLRWGEEPAALVEADLPLFRLGFTSDERAAAAPLLAEARDRLVQETPFGFMHGECTAGHVLAGPGRAWLIDFSHGGFGCQLFDIAAFGLTSGEPPQVRLRLAERYAAALRLPGSTSVLVELAEILWGLPWLLGLSRRLVLAYEDEAASAALALIASRIERGIRSGIGASNLAAEIRHALWPG